MLTPGFSPEELKPNPIQRKSRKTITKNEDKDDKYWVKVRNNSYCNLRRDMRGKFHTRSLEYV